MMVSTRNLQETYQNQQGKKEGRTVLLINTTSTFEHEHLRARAPSLCWRPFSFLETFHFLLHNLYFPMIENRHKNSRYFIPFFQQFIPRRFLPIAFVEHRLKTFWFINVNWGQKGKDVKRILSQPTPHCPIVQRQATTGISDMSFLEGCVCGTRLWERCKEYCAGLRPRSSGGSLALIIPRKGWCELPPPSIGGGTLPSRAMLV